MVEHEHQPTLKVNPPRQGGELRPKYHSPHALQASSWTIGSFPLHIETEKVQSHANVNGPSDTSNRNNNTVPLGFFLSYSLFPTPCLTSLFSRQNIAELERRDDLPD
jgi:hypothetical protein